MMDGIIVKGIGGFYYVEAENTIYECKARGSFRKRGISPLVGDSVQISINENAENTIDKIYNRKNQLVRPPLANIDTLFIIASIVDPKLNTQIIDKLIAIAEYKSIEPIIVITKTDLNSDYIQYKRIYEYAGFKVIITSPNSISGANEILSILPGKISAFTGNTGVGKSTLLNSISPKLNLQTGDTSKKLGRGKHTTRHCELFKLNGGYVADTPGFSSLDFERCETIYKDDLQYCFREFDDYLGFCKFTTCSHTTDKGCAIIEAVNSGKISKSRHDSYVAMYNDIKDIKQWEKK